MKEKGENIKCHYDKCEIGEHQYNTKVTAEHRRLAGYNDELDGDWFRAIQRVRKTDTVKWQEDAKKAVERVLTKKRLQNTEFFEKALRNSLQEVGLRVNFETQVVMVILTVYSYYGEQGHNSGPHASGYRLLYDYFDLANVNGDYRVIDPVILEKFVY